MSKIVAIGVTLALLTGCSNGFEKYYRPAPPAALAAAAPSLVPPPPTPAVYTHSADMQADGKRLLEDGYAFIGESSFYGPANRSNQEQAVAQGKKVGASVVLFKSEYMDTRSGVVPYTVANPAVVSTVNTSGTVYGNGGSASYSGTGTVATPGGYSTYAIPYSVDRNTFYASYWAKRDPNKIHLGMYYRPLDDATRHKLERNTGLQVFIVIRGTPAFSANFLEGDILLKLNGRDITDAQSLTAELAQLAGQRVTIDLLRGDQPRAIAVTLNP
jgi:PDZ domain-containing protein